MKYSINNIEAPDDWNAIKDIAEFEARCGHENDYYGRAKALVYEAHKGLERSFDQALDYFGKQASEFLSEKSYLLAKQFTFASSCASQRRLMEVMHYCWAVLSEYCRILKEYETDGDSKWLLPLLNITDHLNTAAFEFIAVMKREHEDFKPQEID